MSLSSGQRKYLRSLAHHLKPIVQIGKHGLTTEVVSAAEEALAANELIKVKFQDYKDQKAELAQELANEIDADVIGIIGNIVMLYREHPERERRKIILPA